MGTDWIMKFAMDDTVDESLECMQADLSNMASDPAKIVQTVTLTNFKAVEENAAVEAAVSLSATTETFSAGFFASSLVNNLLKNVCRVGVSGLYATTSHNQLDASDTLLDISSLTFDSCPQGAPAGSSFADVAVSLVQLTQMDNGDTFSSTSDFNSFFSNASSGD